MLSDWWKGAFKMASKDPQKFFAKKCKKTWICPASLAISEALTINPTNFLRPLFNSQFFLSFNFHFGHKKSLEGDYFSICLRLSSQACSNNGRRRKSPLDGTA